LILKYFLYILHGILWDKKNQNDKSLTRNHQWYGLIAGLQIEGQGHQTKLYVTGLINVFK